MTDKQERRIDVLITEVFGEGEEAELIRAAIREALSPTKRVRQQQQCPKCKYLFRGEFTVRDSAFVLDTIKWLAERLAGRPGVQNQSGGGETWVFLNRIINPPCDGCKRTRDGERDDTPGRWLLIDRDDKDGVSETVFKTREELTAFVNEGGLDDGERRTDDAGISH